MPLPKQLFREVFGQAKCSNCRLNFTHDGVDVLHEGKNFMLLRINCTACLQVAGVAILRFSEEQKAQMEKEAAYDPLVDRDDPVVDLLNRCLEIS